MHVRAYEINATLLLGTVSVEIICLKKTGARRQPNVINLVKFHEYEEWVGIEPHKSLKQLINLFGLKGCHDQHRIIFLMCLFFVLNVFFCMLCYIVTTMVKYLVIMIINVEIEFVFRNVFVKSVTLNRSRWRSVTLESFCTAWAQSGRHPNNLAHICLETVSLFIYTVYIGQ